MTLTASWPGFPCAACEIRDSAICAALNDEERGALNRLTTEVSLEPEQIVFHETDESTFLFNVVRGVLRLTKLLPSGKRQITGFLYPGDFLGLSIAGIYPYSAEAIVPTKLCRFPRSSLMQLVEKYPKLEHRLLALASNELIEAQDHITLLGRMNASEKITTFLLKLTRRLGSTTDGTISLDAPMSRADMADYLGLTIETVSRILSSLQRSRIIRLPKARHIEILKPERLEEMAEES